MTVNIIERVLAREILDSRGNPTVEADVTLRSGHTGRMMVPSGASTGIFEALELRDGDSLRYRGKGVRLAVEHVNTIIAEAMVGFDAEDQEAVDRRLIELDGTLNKSRLGANGILGVSVAVAHAIALSRSQPLYRYICDCFKIGSEEMSIPLPMVNMISGGAHAGGNIDLQDFLIYPIGAGNYRQALEMISSTYWSLQKVLHKKGYQAYLLADEGGFGPSLGSNREALDLLCEAITRANMRPGDDIAIALDVASSQFFDPMNGLYHLRSENKQLTSLEMVDMLEQWVNDYPILSIEDGLAEEDWEGWVEMTKRLGDRVQLVGDDLFTTNTERIAKGIQMKAGNSVLIKMNQIGTLSETAQAVKLANNAGFTTVISARSGETEDATLADLAVGLAGRQIKIGSLAGSSRLSKYNQLLRIDEQLFGKFAGRSGLPLYLNSKKEGGK